MAIKQKTTHIDEHLCPRCGQTNLCQNVQTSAKASKIQPAQHQKCWCMELSFTAEQRQAISEYECSSRCLCSKCLASIVTDLSDK